MKFQLLDCCEFPRPNICLSCAIANIFDYHFVHTIIACVWWGASVWYRCGWGIEGEEIAIGVKLLVFIFIFIFWCSEEMAD